MCSALACGILPNGIVSATTWQVLMSRQQDFAASLRWWRRHRDLSQLDLAGRTGISQRHLSFMELGRASPSRDMVLRLAAALDVPLRQHNALMIAAGFAPVWRQTDLAAPELSEISSALDYMLAQQEPFPAVAVDRHWNLLRSNSGAVRLVEFLVGPLAPDTPVNLADALVAPDLLRPHLVNWAEVVRYFIRSVEADAAADGTPETAALLKRLLSYPRRAAGAQCSASRIPDHAGACHAFPQRQHELATVHDHRHTGNAPRHHTAGTSRRMFLSDGCADRRRPARLACSVVKHRSLRGYRASNCRIKTTLMRAKLNM
jgi:transcriptional regulator with XRE-family HTH domain